MSARMWTVPNVLTGLRLLAVPVLGAVLVVAGDSPGGRSTALALFVAASLTDVADGWLARRLGQCTDFGALADPIADKALVATALVCLSASGLVPWWATTVILAREVAVTALRLRVLRHGVIPASRGGKVKTVTQTALIVLALATPGWTDVLTAVVLVTVVWTVGTGLDYGVKAAALSGATVWLPAPRPATAGSVLHPLPLVPDVGPQQGGGGASSRVRS